MPGPIAKKSNNNVGRLRLDLPSARQGDSGRYHTRIRKLSLREIQ